MHSPHERMPWTADTQQEVVRRLGAPPQDLGVSTSGATCPDVFQLRSGSDGDSSGDYLVIGTDVTEHYRDRLPEGAGCGPHERAVMIPAATFFSVVSDVGARVSG